MQKVGFKGWAFLCAWVAAMSAFGATTAEQPIPNHKAYFVGANPTLMWNLPGENLLVNGSFEQGTNGWSHRGRLVSILLSSTFKPADGTNFLSLNNSFASQKVALPNTKSQIIWSFAAGRHAPQFLNTHVLNSAGRLVQKGNFLMQGQTNGWNCYLVDVSKYAGQTIELAVFSEPIGDGGVVEIDDWSVRVMPDNAAFEVFMSDRVFGANRPMNRLGRTTNAFCRIQNLLTARTYNWRIDTIAAGVTNTGPVWSFDTQPGISSAAFIQWRDLPSVICPDMDIPIEASVRDGYGFALPNSSSFYSILPEAAAEQAREPTVVISEINVDAASGIELLNVSSREQDLSNWSIEAGNFASSPKLKIQAGSKLSPGGIATIKEDQGAPGVWPNLRLGDIGWQNELRLSGGVILRDASSNVVDCAFINRNFKPAAPSYIQFPKVTAIDWRGEPLTNYWNSRANWTFQRMGTRDQNSAEDWTFTTNSMGTLNARMSLPFSPGFGKITATFGKPTNFINLLRTSVRFAGPITNASLLAISKSQPGSPSLFGYSEPFQVAVPSHCIALSHPLEIPENSSFFPLQIQLAAPAENDVHLSIVSSNTTALQIPGDIVIPAGESSATAQLTIVNNALLEGSKIVGFTVEAEGYSGASSTVRIDDDEFAALSINVIPTIQESENIVPLTITSSIAPDAPIDILLAFDTGIFGERRLRMEPGTNVVTYFFGAADKAMQGNHFVTATASFGNWTPASALFEYKDSPAPPLVLVAPGFLIEGTSALIELNFGDYYTTTNQEVSLVSSNPEILAVPAKAPFDAGSRSASFVAVAVANSDPAYTQTVRLTATYPGAPIGFADITVYMMGPMTEKIRSLRLLEDGRTLAVRFETGRGWTYRLVVSPALDGEWALLAEPYVIGTGDEGELQIDVSQSNHAFYRLIRSND